MEVGVKTILYVALLWLGANPVLAPGTAARNTTSASALEFGRQYLQWELQHPEANPSKERFSSLALPTLDLYSPSGIAIYYGADSAKNAAFLRSLPQGIAGATKANVVRPSLKDAIEMFPEFKAEEDLLLADKRYTVFAVTYPGWEEAKEQNDALAKLRERAEQAKIRILEVRLHHP
jgi:hypothetical protein